MWLEMSKISRFVISKHSWKCHYVSLEIPDVVVSNTAGHVAMSHQKCRWVLCHKQLQMSRRLLENTKFSRHKHGWKCREVSSKISGLMPQILLEMSRRSIKNIKWFHTYRDEMQSGTAVLLLRGKSARIVKLKWCGRNVWLVQSPTYPCFTVTQCDWSSSLSTNEPLEWSKKWRDHQKTTLTNHSDSENSDTVAWGWGQLVATSHCNLEGRGQLTGPRQSQL